MKKRILLIIVAVFVFTGLYAAPETPLNILFLGNSLTYTNDIPNTLRLIAAAEGITITVTTIANGGWTLHDHLMSATSTNAINAGGWDYVVLQEQSQTSAYTPAQFSADVTALDALIKAAGARTMLYQNWPLNTEMTYQATYDSVWRTVAANLCAVLVPAGDAWYSLYLNDNPTWVGLYADDRHPTQTGAYLTAATFFSVLFGKPPMKQDPVFGLSSVVSSQFQSVADAAVLPWRAVAAVTAPVNEATEGGTNAVLRFDISLPDICDTIIYYSLSGTAIPGIDTSLTSGKAVIPIGLTSTAINVNAIVDGIVEGDETLIVTLWGGPYYSVGTQGSVTLTLHDGIISTKTITPTQTPVYTSTVTPTKTIALTDTVTQTITQTATQTVTANVTATCTATVTATQQTQAGVLEITDNKNVFIYPNPYNGAGDIKAEFGLSKNANEITLKIYTQAFRHVLDLTARGSYATGSNTAIFNSEKMSKMANGIYLFTGEVVDSAGNRAKSKMGTMLIIK